MTQRTLDDADRDWQIARLTRSLARWRAQGLDAILPDEYARYCATLAHLEAGGAYVVRPVDMRAEIFADIGRGLAAISRSTAAGRRRIADELAPGTRGATDPTARLLREGVRRG